jgi:hypothetical protein
MTLLPQFDLLRLLQRHGVPFVIVGGHAVTFHGYVRATEDVDVVWVRSPQAERALLDALLAANACWIADEVDPASGLERLVPVTEPYVKATRLMMLATDYGFLDVFDYVPGCPDADAHELWARAIDHEGLRYAPLDWLVRMKQASGRPKDLDDLQNLID